MNPLISIIVPVYNVEKYLKKCLNSIINQTMQNFEVILINDGSVDSCSSILKNYCEQYNKFNLIEIENSGVAVCRNIGLSTARGEFVVFIDSDDFIAPTFLEKLYRNAMENKSDIAICNYLTYNSKKHKNRPNWLRLKSGIYKNPKILSALICDTRIHHHVWNKLFKRSLLIENNITFNNMCFEDVEFTIKAFYFSNSISIIDDHLYYYVQHGKNTIKNITLKQVNDYLFTNSLTRTFLTQQGEFQTYKLWFFVHSIRTLFITIKLIFLINVSKRDYKCLFYNLKKAFLTIIKLNSRNFDSAVQDYLSLED